MLNLERGFRDKLDKYITLSENIIIDLSINGHAIYDFSCFGVDSENKLSDERYMIFYNQTSSPERAITYEAYNSGARFNVNLSQLPYSINKLVFTASIDGAGTMGEITSLTANVTQNSNIALSMNLSGQDFNSERAIITLEIYHKETSWRINAVASGFNGGLSELLKFYGGTEDTGSNSQPSQDEKQNIPVARGSKVELRKNEKVRLEKFAAHGEILINLNWKHAASKSGLFTLRKIDRAKSIDLDIGCLYELTNGKRGSIQALGNKFGSLTEEPFIALDKDDRTGDTPEGENLRINLANISQIKRVLIYTFIYEGVNNWQEADGIVTIKVPGSSTIIIKLDEYDTDKIMCALVMLENINNETFSAEKLIKFFDGHISLDNAYNWGLKWVRGTKDLQVPSV